MATPKAGGFKLSLASAKSKPGLRAPLEKPAKRPRLNLGDDEPDDDNKKQEISGWDAAEGGAVELNGKKEEKKGPRIIPSLPNRNWREEALKRKLAQAGVPPGQNGHAPEKMEEANVTHGLTIFKKEIKESRSPEPMDITEDGKPQGDGLTEEQRLEKRALDVLIHGKAEDQTIIPLQSEEDAFQNDILNAPEAPTLEDYQATPIEGFGAALLRGMGWKDGEQLGRDKKPMPKPKEIKRRPALLGIGAKEESAVGIELGEWGKGKKKVAMTYNPVMLQNKVTGEKLTEDELKERLEAQKLLPEAKPPRSSKHGDDDDDDRRREKRRDRKDRDRRDDDHDGERRRDRDRRRDKDDDYYSDRERRREKKKHRDDDYEDSDRRRERKRDRDRRDRSRSRDDDDDDERREKRRDRDGYDRKDRKERDRRRRSRSPDSDERREKRRERERRDRERSRSRDSEDRRKRRRDYEDDDRDERKRRYKDDKYYRK